MRIDAVVTDARGRVVRDLKADDFAIVEDGAPETVEVATFVANDAAADSTVVPVLSRTDEQTEAGRPGARLFAIFLDEYHIAKGEESERARELVTRFLDRDFTSRDLAIIVKPLDSLLNLRMTHDRAALLAAVATFEGRKGDYEPKTTFEQNYFAAAPERVEAMRSQIVTSALNALALHVGNLQPGRKTMLLVSDGFTRPPRRRDEALPTIDSVTRSANRSGVSIYTVDPRALIIDSSRGATSAAIPGETDALRTLAADTDGRAALLPADLSDALPRIASDASGYYLLSFHPAHSDDVRTFHAVGVRVKRPNLVVHARRGYWSATAEDLVRARAEKRMSIPTPPPQPMRHSSPLIRPWFGVARVDEAPAAASSTREMQVHFVWEPVPPVPGDRIRTGPPARISVKASRATDGAVVFEGDVRPSTELTFDTAPGRLLLVLAIHDADDHVLDTDVRDVIVGALTGRVEVGTPQVMRAESAREFREIENDPSAVPVATRDFARGDHLVVRLPVYAGASPVDVTATLATKSGAPMRSLPVAGKPNAVYETDLLLSALPPGEYAISIKAANADGDASETVPFRIVQ